MGSSKLSSSSSTVCLFENKLIIAQREYTVGGKVQGPLLLFFSSRTQTLCRICLSLQPPPLGMRPPAAEQSQESSKCNHPATCSEAARV
ncbi:hypothetical protein KUDE01_006099 [Dissostichus eleginoides]|uniref:Uncharacterized protein n=1 Tax=Dissostichus eleginoides TaxID=100907 RepID=A0AAD9FHQ7_DISEL|nr:hypothetical protein KUDE01_006099 [Dissostichus eleginoides]